MNTDKRNVLLALGLFLGVLFACNFTTANISSVKIASDEEGKNETRNFRPGDKVNAIAVISNNGGKVQVKFRVLFDEVEGQESGSPVQGAEKTLDIDGSRPAHFWVTLPNSGFHNGRFKVEITMLKDGEQKDQKTATFEVSGY